MLNKKPSSETPSYQASVLRCFVPSDFNEELPLYILDIGETMLVLFGQWMYDPHTLVVRKEVFESWNPTRAFFADFSLRCVASQGKVLQLVVDGTDFVKTQQLPPTVRFKRLSEYQFIAGRSETLIQDLEKAGLIEPGQAKNWNATQ